MKNQLTKKERIAELKAQGKSRWAATDIIMAEYNVQPKFQPGIEKIVDGIYDVKNCYSQNEYGDY